MAREGVHHVVDAFLLRKRRLGSGAFRRTALAGNTADAYHNSHWRRLRYGGYRHNVLRIEAIFGNGFPQGEGGKACRKAFQNADAVSSVCCDVVGDICGVVSGVCAAAIAGTLLKNATDENLNFWISVLVSAIVSTATITFKALAKNLAVSKANNILFGVCRVLSIFSKEK